jgi:hypothetical protein
VGIKERINQLQSDMARARMQFLSQQVRRKGATVSLFCSLYFSGSLLFLSFITPYM